MVKLNPGLRLATRVRQRYLFALRVNFRGMSTGMKVSSSVGEGDGHGLLQPARPYRCVVFAGAIETRIGKPVIVTNWPARLRDDSWRLPIHADLEQVSYHVNLHITGFIEGHVSADNGR